jgi:hypothetical protein
MTWLFVRISPEEVITIPVAAPLPFERPRRVWITTTPEVLDARAPLACETAPKAAAARASAAKTLSLRTTGIRRTFTAPPLIGHEREERLRAT